MKLWIVSCSQLNDISDRTLFKWIRQGKIHAYKFPLDRKTYVEEEEVLQVLQKERSIHEESNTTLLWINKCAELVHVDRTTIYKWIHEGNVQSYKFAGDSHSYVNPEEVKAMLPFLGRPRKLLTVRKEIRPLGQGHKHSRYEKPHEGRLPKGSKHGSTLQ